MSNVLSKKFTFWSLLKFTTPTIIMMVFMSLYTMVDGIFVSRFVGTNALSAVNIVYPALNIVIAIGIMLATGGSAVIARKMGENKPDEAKENFTLIVAVGIIAGLFILIVGITFIKPIITMLGANEAIFQYCLEYGVILLLFTPFAILQMLFQYFFVTAGKPNVGLIVTLIGGAANIVLDYIFIVPMQMGIAGAAIATGIGFSIPAIFGLIYFYIHKKGAIHFVKPKLDWRALLDSCTNGSSEMITNLSVAITTFLFNIMMMKYVGADGVAAMTIVLYSQYLLTAVYLGYSSGIAPVISYNYGNENVSQLKKLFKTSMIFLAASSILIYILSRLLSTGIVAVFAKEGSEVYNIAKNGFTIFAFSYLFIGVNIFASALFTALSNGKVSAIISFMRTFVFIIGAILILPQQFGIDGIWLAVPVAEVLAVVISLLYIVKLRKVYNYA